MAPRPDLNSTGLHAREPRHEYLDDPARDAPASPSPLQPGIYSVEWFGVDGRETVEANDVTVDTAGPVGFHPPLDTEPSVLYLRSR